MPTCDLYLRLSDARVEEALEGRAAKLRAFAASLGWIVFRVVIENDMIQGKDGKLYPRPASAFKRKKIITPSGRKELRTVRPGFREVLDDITTGRANGILAEDLDRVVRDPRDLEDLIDACEEHIASARSLSGSLTLTDGGTDAEITTARLMVTMANKSSRDTRRRVAESRERLNGSSYQGGPRPYGFVRAQDTEKYHRTLLIVPDEADVLRKAADDILNKDISLRAAARDLRERVVPTANGGKWNAALLKKVLLKPAIAGLSVHKGVLKPAPWPAILEQDVWEKLKTKLEEPSRRTPRPETGNEPRWLLSGIGKCGVCQGAIKATGSEKHDGPTYTCREGFHVRRKVAHVDSYVEGLIIGRLSQPDVRDILRPPVRKGIDTASLRAEAKKLRERKTAQMRLHASGAIDDDDLATGMREIRDRLAVVESQLRESDEPDPLAEFRDKPAEVVWNSLSLARKRAIVRLLVDVTFLPTTRRGRGFDPDSLGIVRKV